jgi:hypothetical protein
LYENYFGIIAFSVEEDGLTLVIEVPPIAGKRQGVAFSVCPGQSPGQIQNQNPKDSVSLFLQLHAEALIVEDEATYLEALSSTVEYSAIDTCVMEIEELPIGEHILYIQFKEESVPFLPPPKNHHTPSASIPTQYGYLQVSSCFTISWENVCSA